MLWSPRHETHGTPAPTGKKRAQGRQEESSVPRCFSSLWDSSETALDGVSLVAKSVSWLGTVREGRPPPYLQPLLSLEPVARAGTGPPATHLELPPVSSLPDLKPWSVGNVTALGTGTPGHVSARRSPDAHLDCSRESFISCGCSGRLLLP